MNGNQWGRVLERIRRKVNSHSFNTWFKPTQLSAVTGGAITLAVPNLLFAEWLRNNYLPLISQIVQEVDGKAWEVVFTCPDDAPGQPHASLPVHDSAQGKPPAVPWGLPSPTAATPQPPSGTLNPRYTFEAFVVGAGNQFAHAAAQAVAERPSQSYNPLYIYGGVGLGKTHLMQAIASRLLASGRGYSLHYVTTETFMNELITAIRHEKTMEFKEKYRRIDVLLVDDIQFLAGKERTQEEFFHTFNALYDARKQIVLTSDCAPRQIRALEERLRSRFEWGLIADIQPPDLETKIAILNRNAEVEGVQLPSDVALFIASKIRSNVRELEGSLVRLLALSSLSGREVDIDLAKEVLREIFATDPPAPTVEAIQKHVAEHFNLKVAELKSRNHSKHVSLPRQVAMYISKSLTDQSLPEIGRRFGGKHHTTVLHAVRRIGELRRADRDLDRVIHSLTDALR